jgi:hypothetical protein
MSTTYRGSLALRILSGVLAVLLALAGLVARVVTNTGLRVCNTVIGQIGTELTHSTLCAKAETWHTVGTVAMWGGVALLVGTLFYAYVRPRSSANPAGARA